MAAEQTRLEWIVTGQEQVKQMTSVLEKLTTVQNRLAASFRIQNNMAVNIKRAADAAVNLTAQMHTLVGLVRKQGSSTLAVAENIKTVDKRSRDVLISWQGIQRIIVGSLISRGIGRLLRSLRQGAEEALEFGIRIGELRTISHDAQLSFGQWTDGVRALSDEWARQPLDVIEGAYQTLSNQVAEGAKALSFMNEALRLSIITVSSTEQAVQALTGVINSYNMSISDARYISNTFFKMVEEGRLRLGDIANTMGRVNILSAQLNVGFKNTAVALDVLTRQGVPAQEGMMFLRNVMLKLVRPTEAMERLFEEWGVTSAKAAVEAFGFVGVLEKLEKTAKESGDELTELGELFSRMRAITGATALVSNLDLFNKTLEEFKDATKDADQALKDVQETMEYKLSRELQRLRNFFLVDIGQTMIHNLVRLTDKIGGLAKAVTAVVKATQYLLPMMLLLGSGGIIRGIGLLGKAIFSVGGATTTLATVVGAVTYQIASSFIETAQIIKANWWEVAEDQVKALKWAAEQAGLSAAQVARDSVRKTQEMVDGIFGEIKRLYAEIRSELNATRTEMELQFDIQKALFEARLEATDSVQAKIQLAKKRIADILKDFDRMAAEQPDLAMKKIQEIEKILDRFKSLRGETILVPWERGGIRFIKGTATFMRITANAAADFNTSAESLYERLQNIREETSGIKANMEDYLDNMRQIKTVDEDLAAYKKAQAHAQEALESSGKRQEAAIKTNKVLMGEVLGIFEQIRIKAEAAYKAAYQARGTAGMFGVYEPSPAWLDKIPSLIEFLKAYKEADVKTLDPSALAMNIAPVLDMLRELDIFPKTLDEQLTAKMQALEAAASNYATTTERINAAQKAVEGSAERYRLLLQTLDAFENRTKDFGAALVQNLDTVREALLNSITELVRATEKLYEAERALRNAQTQGEWKGGYMSRFASGGSVASDSVPALLRPGEFVMNKDAARQFFPQLVAMNSGAARFDSGGDVVNNNIGDINVTVQGGDTSEITIRRIAAGLRREVHRGTIKLK